jgi:ferredoxin-NADP reductase
MGEAEPGGGVPASLPTAAPGVLPRRPRPAPQSTRWRRAVVRQVDHPRPRAVVLRLEVPGRVAHVPGQHYVVRLTAEDGYRASRSYSVASSPSDPLVELYVERLDEGEVSTYLADAVEPGDELEVRGPIGGWFAWDGLAPAVGVGGGSGVVPLVAMLRHALGEGHPERLRLVVAARTAADLPYGDELAAGGARRCFSRASGDDGRPAGRLAAADLGPVPPSGTTIYVCGSAGFAEHASRLLVDLGVAAADIRVEKFGPSGT